MKKLLLGAAAFGLLSGAALAEPQKLDDSLLGDVAGGFIDLSTTTGWSMRATEETISNAIASENLRQVSQTLASTAANNNYATGLMGSENVSAMGTSAASVMAPVAIMP